MSLSYLSDSPCHWISVYLTFSPLSLSSPSLPSLLLSLSNPPPQLDSTVISSALESVLLELRGLKDFLDKNAQFSPSSLGAPR